MCFKHIIQTWVFGAYYSNREFRTCYTEAMVQDACSSVCLNQVPSKARSTVRQAAVYTSTHVARPAVTSTTMLKKPNFTQPWHVDSTKRISFSRRSISRGGCWTVCIPPTQCA